MDKPIVVRSTSGKTVATIMVTGQHRCFNPKATDKQFTLIDTVKASSIITTR